MSKQSFTFTSDATTGAELVTALNQLVGNPWLLVPADNAGIPANSVVSVQTNLTAAPSLPAGPAPSLFPDSAAVINTAPLIAANIDGRGVPWDERIHSGGRAINADGSWKKRKGVDPKNVAKIEAQLLAALVDGTAPPAPQASAPSAPTAPAPIAPAAPTAPQAVAIPESAPTDFASLIRWTAKRSNTPGNPTGKLQQSMIDDIISHYKLSSIQDVSSKPEYVGVIYQYLTQTIGEPFLPGHVEIL